MAVKKKIPMRKCVGCGEMKPKKELMRILRTEDDFVSTPPERKTDGVHISATAWSVFKKQSETKVWKDL